MVSVYTCYTFQNVSTPLESSPITVGQGDLLTVEVSGTASSMDLVVEGCADLNSSNYTLISGINLQDLSTIDSISANGLYQFSVSGLGRLVLNLTSVSGGPITVFSRISKEG